MKIPFGTEVGLGPGDIVLSGDSAPLETGIAPPHFAAHVCCGQMAGWIKMPLDAEVGLDLGPGHIVFDVAQLPPGKGHSSPPLSDPCLLWSNGPISATTELLLYNRKINMTVEDKIKTKHKEVTKFFDDASQNLKPEFKKNKLRRRRVVKKSQSQSKEFDAIDVRL